MKLGIDVGGTKTKVAVINDTYEIIAANSYPTVTSPEAFVEFMAALIKDYRCSFPEIACVGIGIPGKVNTGKNRGYLVYSPALQIQNMDLCQILSDICGLPIFAENDVNAWALAEKAVGSCKEVDNYVLIAIGTGIGSGIVIGGRVYHGFNYEAGEIGYMVSEEDFDSPCPSKSDFGAFERKASAIAISCRYYKLTGEQIDTREIFIRALQHGDQIALDLIQKQMRALSVGISNIICLLQPQKIVIGGGLAGEGEYLIQHLNQYVRRLIPTEVPVVLSGAGKWGGAVGAALSAEISAPKQV